MSTGLEVGSILADYQLAELIGRGGMGVVYRAQDLRLGRQVALKLITPGRATDPEFRSRFLRESRLAASIDHSHIIPIYEAGAIDDQLFLAMRYVDGSDLRRLLRDTGALAPARAVDLCSQVGSALDAAHAKQLVHRDVKPANILVSLEGDGEHCCLTDFGLARDSGHDDDSQDLHLSGTVDYTAPEQIAQGSVDGRADVYSLACVLYECLCGEPPFARSRPTATLFAQLRETPKPLHLSRRKLPEKVDDALLRGLAKQPDDRWSTCGELCQAMRDAFGLEPRVSRRSLLLVAGGAALAAAAAATVPAIVLTRGAPKPEAAPVLFLRRDSIVRIDPTTSRAVSVIPSGPEAGPLALDGNVLWQANESRQTVKRIDVRTETVVGEIATHHTGTPDTLAAMSGRLWVSSNDAVGPYLFKHDKRTSSFVGIETKLLAVFALAVSGGSLWACDGTVVRIDPETDRVLSTIVVEEGIPRLMASGAQSIWLADQSGPANTGLLWRVDPKRNAADLIAELDVTISGVAEGAGSVWIAGVEDDVIRQVDLATFDVRPAFSVGRIPETLSAGTSGVWVGSARDETVTRYDPETADIAVIHVGGIPRHLVIGPDAVWVAVEAA